MLFFPSFIGILLQKVCFKKFYIGVDFIVPFDNLDVEFDLKNNI